MTTFTVTTTNDTGAGSLRDAIAQANALAGADTIVFNPTFFTGGAANLIRLTSGQIAITDVVTINGSAVGGVTITGDKNDNDVTLGGTDITDVAASGAALLADNSRILNIAVGADTTLQGLTLTGGRTTANFQNGGAVYSLAAVTLIDSAVSGNSTTGDYSFGGAIYNNDGTYDSGTVTLVNSTVSGNSTAGVHAWGGGIAGYTLTLTNSTVSGNSTTGTNGIGGGLFVFGDPGNSITLTNSTVSGNSTTGDDSAGGGICSGQTVTLTNSTVSGNFTAGNNSPGGGVFGVQGVTLINSTVSGNSTAGTNADAGGVGSDSTVTLTNTIVLGNVSAQTTTDEISGTIAANGLNIVGTGGDSDPSDHVINADPTFVFAQTAANGAATAGVLADNGGPVQTIALKFDAANAALDAGDDSLAPALDARGLARSDVAGAAHNGANISDLGAFELQTTITVTNNNDAGAGSLRDAIAQANATPGEDTIVFDPTVFTGGTANLIRLQQGEIAISDAVTIDGSAVGGVTITGDKNGNDVTLGGTAITNVAASGAGLLADNSRIFTIASGADTTLQGLTLTGGRTTANGPTAHGGAVLSQADLTLLDSTVSGNSTAGEAADGGGIRGNTVTLINSTVSGNSTADASSDGGGIYGNTVTLTNSTVSGNSVAGFLGRGGGILGSTVTLTDSTVSGNSTARGFGDGGGIWGSSVTLTNSTVSGNTATGNNTFGGGIYGDVVTLTNSTVSGNSTTGNGTTFGDGYGYGGGGIAGHTVTLTNSTVSGNSATGSDADAGGIRLVTYFSGVATVTLTNTIVLGNVSEQRATDEIAGADSGTIIANGLNIVGTGADSDPSDHLINADPAFVFAGPLANNGGPVQTIALKLDVANPALDAGDDSLAPALDARGLARANIAGVGATVSDLGAFELQNGGNVAPVTVADAFTVAEGGAAAVLTGGATSVLANDSDAESNPLTAILVAGPAHGALTLNPNGTFSYTHNGSETTSDSFSYKANDGTSDSAPVTVSITITPVNDAPVVSGPVTLSAMLVDSGARLITQGQLLAHASDVDGPSLTAVNLQIAAGAGSLTDNNDGTWSFTPAPGDETGVTFSYQVTDGTAPVATSANLDLTTVVTGTSGDDSYDAPSGSSAFDAGLGVDTMTFSFTLTEATFAWSGNQVTVTHGADQTVLAGFERFVFADGTVDNNDGSPLIDDLFYYAQNRDVWNAHVDADFHYNAVGWREGRDPSAFFDTSLYLAANPDVAAAGFNPLSHFGSTGWKEGRMASLTFDARQYLSDNPDVAAANVDPLWHFLAVGASEGRQPTAPATLAAANGFDFVYYLQQNPDVAAAGVDPFWHFQTTGWHEGRNPNAFFDTAGYLAAYTDVAAAGMNPLDHYHVWGWREGRDPSLAFDTAAYLAANTDVAAAHIDPLQHFIHVGLHEGRVAIADAAWG